MLKKSTFSLSSSGALLVLFLLVPMQAGAAHFKIDPVKSYVRIYLERTGPDKLLGTLPIRSGEFVHDPDNVAANAYHFIVGASEVGMPEPEGSSVLSNLFDLAHHPEFQFSSSTYKGDDGGGDAEGMLRLHAARKNIKIELDKAGKEKTKDGRTRVMLNGEASIRLNDFRIRHDLGDADASVRMELYLVGVK